MFQTLAIPSMVNKGKDRTLWDPAVCMLFLDQVLDFLIHNIPSIDDSGDSAAGEDSIYELSFDPQKKRLELRASVREPYEQIEKTLYSLWEPAS